MTYNFLGLVKHRSIAQKLSGGGVCLSITAVKRWSRGQLLLKKRRLRKSPSFISLRQNLNMSSKGSKDRDGTFPN